jgi:hypothetical protein
MAAHHEAAHAVVAVALGLPLQDTGLHIDTVDGGITFDLHRTPGDPGQTPEDIEEGERSIVMIKAGYCANVKLFPGCPVAVAADDRQKEMKLLNEMYPQGGQAWIDADNRLGVESRRLVDLHWDAVQALAQAVLAKPVTPRPPESFRKWVSPYPDERWIDGDEIGSLLKRFGLNVIVRKEVEGIYLSPDIHQRLQ